MTLELQVRQVLAELGFSQRHLPGQHDQSDHGKKGGAKALLKTAAKAGQEALDSSPAKLVDDGLGPLNPRHVRGKITWSSGDPGWSDEEHEARLTALEGYRGADYAQVNTKLRGMPPQSFWLNEGGVEEFDQRTDEKVALLDSVMDHSRLTSAVSVLRGSSTGRGVFGSALDGDLAGFEWTEGAYTSTTANPAIAEYFTISGLLMTITVPKGVGVVNLSPLVRPTDGGDDEAELLLERGLRMRVVTDSGPGNPRHLEVEVVGGD